MKTVEKVKEVKNEEIISGNDNSIIRGENINILMCMMISGIV